MTVLQFTAGYVPSIAHKDLAWHTLTYGAGDTRLEVKVPILTPAQILAVTQHIKSAVRTHIKTMAVSDIVRAIDLAVLRLLDINHEDRKRIDTLMPIATGMDATMLRHNIAVGRTLVSPSETIGRLCGTPPASQIPFFTLCANSSRCILHGAKSEAVLSIAICGREPSKAASGFPRRIHARCVGVRPLRQRSSDA